MRLCDNAHSFFMESVSIWTILLALEQFASGVFGETLLPEGRFAIWE